MSNVIDELINMHNCVQWHDGKVGPEAGERERERDADADRECIVADCRRPGVELDLHGAV